MLIPVPLGTQHTAKRRGSISRKFTCENCLKDYNFLVSDQIVSRATSPLFLDNAGAKARAEQGASSEALIDQLERKVVCVPCPHCGWYQAHMVRHRRRFWKVLAILGSLLAYVGGLLVTKDIYDGRPITVDSFRYIILAAGPALLLTGMVVRFIYSPNRSSAETRKTLGRKYAISDVEAASAAAPAKEPALKASFYVDSKGQIFTQLPH